MIRAIIFDCFGVIITDALQLIREEVQAYNPEGAQAIKDIIAATNRGFIEPSESNERTAAILGVTVAEYRGRIADGEVKDQRLLDYILNLRQTHKTAMLSNIPGPSLTRRFPNGELDQYFDVVVASGDIGYAKPEPEAYEIVAERLGLRCDECLFTDDREVFCEAATSVGMQSIVYTNFDQFRTDFEKIVASDS